MYEQDYVKVANRVKVSAALTILRDVLEGDEYGITEKDIGEIKDLLTTQELKLFNSVDIENNKPESESVGAFSVIQRVMKGTPGKAGLAHSWHRGLALVVTESILAHHGKHDYASEIGNDAASRFMESTFDVETSQ